MPTWVEGVEKVLPAPHWMSKGLDLQHCRSQSTLALSISMALAQMGLALFPPGCQPEGTFSTPLSTSGGEGETLIQHPSSPASSGDEKTRGLPSWHGGPSGVQM